MSRGFTRQQTVEKAQSGSKGYIVIQLALSIAMLALGVQLQDHCSADERIPIYMIGRPFFLESLGTDDLFQWFHHAHNYRLCRAWVGLTIGCTTVGLM